MAKHRLTCANCHKQFDSDRKKKHCSTRCGETYSKRRRRGEDLSKPYHRPTPKVPFMPCKNCGQEFKAKMINSRKDGKCIRKRKEYCTNECAHIDRKSWSFFVSDDRKKKAFESETIYKEKKLYRAWSRRNSFCEVCGDRFTKASRRQRYCSQKCRLFRLMDANTRDKATKECKNCGVKFSLIFGHRARVCCSDECQHERKLEYKHLQKALRRSAEASGEAFNIYSVFTRDKWTCQCCGCHTPKKLRGSCDDSAPELDHIIPLSRGGEHTMENAQTLCRLCNMIKSDRPMEWLMEWANGAGVGKN